MSQRPSQHDEPEHDDRHDRGLQYDLDTLWQRRRVLQLFAGVGLAAVVGCSTEDAATSSTPASMPATATISGGGSAVATPTVTPIPTTATPLSACIVIPTETAGPFPGNGSNGPNALAQSGIVRSDIRQSVGSANGIAQGVPLTMALTIVDTKNACKPIAGAAVYLWHCDREGRYSMYTAGAISENYLRGVQVADANGVVRFISIFPAAYSGRWPHVHFEVYPSLDRATASGNKLITSQLALPEAVCNAVFATAGYEQSVTNMLRTPLARDNVFANGVDQQMATVTGSVSAGYAASLVVGV